MRLIMTGRRAGKTAAQVRFANDTGAVLVTKDSDEAARVQRGFRPNRPPVTYDAFKRSGMEVDEE